MGAYWYLACDSLSRSATILAEDFQKVSTLVSNICAFRVELQLQFHFVFFVFSRVDDGWIHTHRRRCVTSDQLLWLPTIVRCGCV